MRDVGGESRLLEMLVGDADTEWRTCLSPLFVFSFSTPSTEFENELTITK